MPTIGAGGLFACLFGGKRPLLRVRFGYLPERLLDILADIPYDHTIILSRPDPGGRGAERREKGGRIWVVQQVMQQPIN